MRIVNRKTFAAATLGLLAGWSNAGLAADAPVPPNINQVNYNQPQVVTSQPIPEADPISTPGTPVIINQPPCQDGSACVRVTDNESPWPEIERQKRQYCPIGTMIFHRGNTYPPDHRWSLPLKYPIEETPVVYQRYWPSAWTGVPQTPIAYNPMVYQPTDTMQLGYYYQRVPTWLPDASRIPPPPNPWTWHKKEMATITYPEHYQKRVYHEREWRRVGGTPTITGTTTVNSTEPTLGEPALEPPPLPTEGTDAPLNPDTPGVAPEVPAEPAAPMPNDAVRYPRLQPISHE